MRFFKYNPNKKADQLLKRQLINVLGIRPKKLILYKMALTHSSFQKELEWNNERLEYLGDAILGAVIADYLFKKYPYKGEGFLTDMRSKIVNRQQLNNIAMKMGLNRISIYNKADKSLRNSQIFGNAFESLVGAIYIDKGYIFIHQWIVKYIVQSYLSIDDLENIELNYKNKIISWAQKNNCKVEFEILHEQFENNQKLFTIGIVLNDEIIATGKAFNKKDASQLAAQLAAEKLGIQ